MTEAVLSEKQSPMTDGKPGQSSPAMENQPGIRYLSWTFRARYRTGVSSRDVKI